MNTRRVAQIGGGVAAAGAAAWLLLRPWTQRWGATDAEAKGPMLGDEEVPDARTEDTLGITIHAPADRIWRWLVQMGNGRGGFYSYDWIDRTLGYLEHDSVREIRPELQELKAGDLIPVAGAGEPGFRVKTLEPNRGMVLVPEGLEGKLSWSICLFPIDGKSTRLVTRYRTRSDRNVTSFLTGIVMEPGAFVMTRKWMLNLKRLAEAPRNGKHPRAA